MAGKTHYRPRIRKNVNCRVCGSGFAATQKSARYCSAACRQQISRALRLVERVANVEGKVVTLTPKTTKQKARRQ